jgi:transposase
MGKTFRAYDMDQMMLLPPDLRQWLREDHLALHVSDVIDELDLSSIMNVYEQGDGRGRPPYHPAMMIKVLVYGYCVGKMSSRKIEQATYDDVAFRVLSCNQQPDHDSIAQFRKRHLTELGQLFVQVLELCRKAGLVKLGHVAIDGTKVKANASKWQTRSYEGLTETERKFKAQVDELLAEAQQIDDQEDELYGPGRRGDELPEELRQRETRLAKIRELKRRMEEEAKEAAEQKAAEAREKNRKREETEKKTGKKTRGRMARVVDPTAAVPDPRTRRNFTDPESRIMKDHATKTFVQGYNAQVGVDAQAQIIVAATVVQETNDQKQLVPVLSKVKENLGCLPEKVSADAGYFSTAAITDKAIKKIDLHVPPNERRPSDSADAVARTGRLQDRMWQKLLSQTGAEVYSRRKAIVEPVFAHLKHIRGFRQFLLRGLASVEAEWLLMCTVHNLLKLLRARKQLKATA